MPYVKPLYTVLVGGNPIIEELQAEEDGKVKPRLLVVKGTADHQVKLAGDGAANVLGIVRESSEKGVDCTFAAGESVAVMSGPAVVVGVLAASQTINKGDRLKAAADGQVQKVSAATDPVVAIALETISTDVGETKPILMRLVI